MENGSTSTNELITGKDVCLHERNGHIKVEEFILLKENSLRIRINEKDFFDMTCTASDLKELVVGRLYTEGIIDSTDDIIKLYLDGENLAEVTTKNENVKPEFKARLNRTTPKKVIAEDIFSLTDEFSKGSPLNQITGGTHSAILNCNEKTVFSCEDIGRHNCVDKAVGFALLNHIPLEECILFSSGRIPSDMTQKVIAAGIPVLISKGVPTDISVCLAEKHGLTLICRAWPDKYTLM